MHKVRLKRVLLVPNPILPGMDTPGFQHLLDGKDNVHHCKVTLGKKKHLLPSAKLYAQELLKGKLHLEWSRMRQDLGHDRHEEISVESHLNLN